MSAEYLAQLNQRFALPGQLVFKTGPENFPVAEIVNEHALVLVSIYGGQVLMYQPLGQEPVLWLSDLSFFEEGTAIRGGIPICWPWFGPHPTDSDKPAHGFARVQMWEVVGSISTPDRLTKLRLKLRRNAETRALWPHSFELEIIVTVGPALTVELIAHNQGQEAMTCGAALHSYFTVSKIGDVAVLGLEEDVYIDKLDSNGHKQQSGPITFTAETDRIYLDTTADCIIDDPGLARRIRVAKQGSRSTVVWNPWHDKAQRMADFPDEAYHYMLCVETTNAADDLVTIPPGQEHRLVTQISLEL